jgi:hypothetical protein
MVAGPVLFSDRTMSETLQGGCQCGAIRYETTGAPLAVALCHCTMCRHAHAAPAVAWALFAQAQVRFSHAQPTTYASSPEAARGFCAACGTQISFTADYLPEMIDLAVGSFDDPVALAPQFHYWDAERLPWVEFTDRLPRHRGFPPLE